MESNLMDVYRSMLATTAMETTSDGFVRMSIGEGEYLPVTGKDGKVVVLPLVERLRDPKIAEFEVFHLLSENSKVNNASDLLSRYRHWLINRFNIVIGGLGSALLTVAADKAMTKKLRSDQAEFLQLVVEADATTGEAFSKIADICSKPNQITQVFMSMYLRNAAVLDSKSYGRVSTVNFPLFDALKKLDEDVIEAKKAGKAQKKKVEHEVFGVSIRIKDRPAIIGLLHYLIPNLDTPHAYDIGSNSKIAPSIDALMRSFLPMARHLNEIMEIFKGVDPKLDRALGEIEFNLDWADAFDNLDALWPQIRMTPTQNQGTGEEPAPAPATPVAAKTAPWEGPSSLPPYQPAPAAAPYPVPVPQPVQQSGGGASVRDMMHQQRGARHMGQPQPYGYGQQPMHPGMGYPQPQQAYPGAPYPQPQYPQQGYPAPQPAYPQPGMPNYQTGRRGY